MIKYFFYKLSFIFLITNSCSVQQKLVNVEGYPEADKIIRGIATTTFRSTTYNITEYGAVGDGIADNCEIINRTIQKCSDNGGGKVLIPMGIFLVNGPLHLKSNVNLHLEKGAELFFSGNPDDFLPVVFTRWEGVEIYNYSPMIYTVDQENVAITGKGIINGNSEKTWTSWVKKQREAVQKVREYGGKQLPVKERIFGENHYLRSSMIQFINCNKILVEGITLTSSPFWILHPIYSEDIIIRDVNFNSMVINNDGIDIDSSVDVLIEDCTFRTGDDAVVLKSGRDADGWRVGKPTKNVVIRNCNIIHVLHGIAIGSEMSGGIENVYAYNIQMGIVEKRAIQLKANKDRGGYVRDVYVKNVEVDSANEYLIAFWNNYFGYRGGNAPSEFYNIQVENVTNNFAKSAFLLEGLEEQPIHDILFKDIKVNHADQVFKKAVHYKDITMDNVVVNDQPVNLN